MKGRYMPSGRVVNKMKKLYEKNELTFAIMGIVVYCVLQSVANPLNEKIGIEYSASAVFVLLQAVVFIVFIRKNNLSERYGLCKPSVPVRRFLYYVPLVILASGNLWFGIAVNYSTAALISRVVCMLCVGFVEEIIFRGFLFRAMEKNNVKSAIIVSSITFGIGHLVNLFNGSGMDLIANVCQIGFAIAMGFLLVTIFYRGGTLLPCIITHSAINTLGTFVNEAGITLEIHIVHCLIMIIIAVAYTLFLARTLSPKEKSD